MSFYIGQNEARKIKDHYGAAFYDKVLRDIETYSKKWNLEILQMVDYYSVNCIFECRSEHFGDAILKICNPGKEVFTEFNTLLEYDGKRFCRVYISDVENGIILEERIHPGIQLRNEQSLEKRLSVFSSLYKGLHIEPKNPAIYPTYMEWVSRITDYMSRQKDFKELYFYMKKAESICYSLNDLYSKKMLLHGDFHHDNILLNDKNEYSIIDPKGVIGDPIFDVPRFILNEFEDTITDDLCRKIVNIINYFEKSLGIPNEIIKQCLFVEMAMANCWNVESGTAPNLDEVIFTESLLTVQQ